MEDEDEEEDDLASLTQASEISSLEASSISSLCTCSIGDIGFVCMRVFSSLYLSHV